MVEGCVSSSACSDNPKVTLRVEIILLLVPVAFQYDLSPLMEKTPLAPISPRYGSKATDFSTPLMFLAQQKAV